MHERVGWLLEHLSLVRALLPHLRHVDEEDMALRLSAEHGVLVALNEGRIAGFSVWYETLPGVGYIWMIGVVPELRGRGIGKRLLISTLNELEERGYALVWAKVGKDKPWWVREHLKLGFRVLERVEENGGTVYKLVKPLKRFVPLYHVMREVSADV